MTTVADKLAQKSQRRTPRKRVRLRLQSVDVWSAVKLGFLLAFCLGLVTVVCGILLWVVLSSTGVIGSVDSLLNDVTGAQQINVEQFVNFNSVFWFSVIVGVLEVVVLTALSAVGTMLFNLACRLTGGVVVTFTNT